MNAPAASLTPSIPGPAPAPWWRHGHVWLVISGPALVVLASFLTLYLAVTRGDPLVDERYYQAADSVGGQADKNRRWRPPSRRATTLPPACCHRPSTERPKQSRPSCCNNA